MPPDLFLHVGQVFVDPRIGTDGLVYLRGEPRHPPYRAQGGSPTGGAFLVRISLAIRSKTKTLPFRAQFGLRDFVLILTGRCDTCTIRGRY